MLTRIYGLPRSGTNFLEFLIRENTNCVYETEYARSVYINGKSAIKHCKPNDDGKDLYIIIVKNKINFINSYNKWRKTPKNGIIELYNRVVMDYMKFYEENKNKVVIIPYELLLGNEEKVLNKLVEKFGIELTKPIKVPTNVMTRGGGTGTTNVKFNNVGVNNNEYGDLDHLLLKIE